MVFYKFTPALNPITLPGGKLQLRAPQSSDYLAWKQVREASREFLEPCEPPWAYNPFPRLGFRRRLKRYAAERELKMGETYFLVSLKEDCPIGGISISNIRYGASRACSLGYWMGEQHAGKGYMKKCVLAVSDHIFNDLGLCRIEAACLPDNRRSSHLLEHAGFVREGFVRKYLEIDGKRRDHVLYSRLKEDQ